MFWCCRVHWCKRMSIYGIDVSYAQGQIDWSLVAQDKEFAIIRAGYGAGNVDNKANYNCYKANQFQFPVGLYWFSYAYTDLMARREGEYIAQFASQYTIDYPLFWDFEYDSEEYAELNGVTMTPQLYHDMADAFCTAVENAGYVAGLYYNPDFDSRYNISSFFIQHPNRKKWIAKWSTTPPDSYNIWQYGLGSAGSVPGISTDIDLDVMDDVPPTPPTPTTSKMPIWFYLRPY